MTGSVLVILSATANTAETAPVPKPQCLPNAQFIELAKASGMVPVVIGSNMRDGMTIVWMGGNGFAFSYTRHGSDVTCTLANALNPKIDQKLIDKLQPPKKGA